MKNKCARPKQFCGRFLKIWQWWRDFHLNMYLFPSLNIIINTLSDALFVFDAVSLGFFIHLILYKYFLAELAVFFHLHLKNIVYYWTFTTKNQTSNAPLWNHKIESKKVRVWKNLCFNAQCIHLLPLAI